jgi:hypothetical protein
MVWSRGCRVISTVAGGASPLKAPLLYESLFISAGCRKARAERYEVKGYWCYEAAKAATCMAERPPHTLIRVRV